MQNLKSKNISLMYAIQLVKGFVFFLPIIALYLEKDLFTITNVAIIFAVESIAMTIFEMPTGAIADLFGRKNSLIIANIIGFASLAFLYIGGSMSIFVTYAILYALSHSLKSGTDKALIYDTLKEENKEKHYKKIVGKYSALWPVGAMIGSLIGGYLATISLSLPVILTFIPYSISFILILFLKEPKYEHEEHRNVLRHIKESSKIIISDLQLIIIFMSGFFLWGLGESMHRLVSLFLTFKEIPLIYFGLISAFMFGFSAIGHYISHDVSEKWGNKKTLIFSTLGTPILLVIATITTSYSAAMFWAVPSLFFGLRNPIISHLINLDAPSSKRATIISSYNFLTRLGVALFVPFIGYFAELYTINTAFKIGAIMMFIVPILIYFLKDRK